MIQKSLGTIAAADIQGLVADRTPEGRSIEFKRDLPGTRDSDRKEFLADVSSFANALGGDLIFGIEETGGVAAAADGNTENYSYLQIDRAGRIEAAESWMIPSIDPARYPDSIPSGRFPSELFDTVARALRLYELLDVPPPYAVMVSILGAKGVVLALDVFRFRSPLRPLDREALFLPEIIIHDRPSTFPQ